MLQGFPASLEDGGSRVFPGRPRSSQKVLGLACKIELSTGLGASTRNRIGPRASQQTWGTLRERQYAGGVRRGQDLPGGSRVFQQACDKGVQDAPGALKRLWGSPAKKNWPQGSPEGF